MRNATDDLTIINPRRDLHGLGPRFVAIAAALWLIVALIMLAG